ncbi:hypothetical protein B7P43_G10128 [Cryptotermes secundus]|uniref:DOMON domain-containing protein n=1 Tax=Cryptotermes secundus TaxID=105785 RepID=A0A2J7RAD9_9NEOP|nr:hypothetical protein B7P43_G10128 [Cryptotermes secundus]
MGTGSRVAETTKVISVWRTDGAKAWTGAILLTLALGHVTGAHWTHSTDLDPNYSVFWTPGEEDITFEVQVRTLGYVGFGFSADGQMAGADMVTGWVRDNQVFFQVVAFRRADPPSKESYRLCKRIKKQNKRERPNKGL